MSIADWVVTAGVVLLLGFVITYIISEKRKGTRCIGCPHSKICSHCKKSK